MEVLVKQRFNFQTLLRRFERFAGSEQALAPLGCFVLCFHLFGWDIAGITLLAAYMIFVFLSDAPIRGVLPALMMVAYVISVQNGVTNTDGTFHPEYLLKHLWYIGTLGGFLIASAIYGIYKRRLRFRLTYGFLGVAAMGASLILSGIFSEGYTFKHMLGGVVITSYFLLFFVFCAFVAPHTGFDYIAKTVTVSTLVVMAELLCHFLRIGALTPGGGALVKQSVILGWGMSNSIAPMIAVGLPFSVYYMSKIKHAWFAFLIFLAQAVVTVLCLSRGMLLFAVPFAVIGFVYALFRQRGTARVQLIVIGAVLAAAITLFVLVSWEEVARLINFYIENGFQDSNRFNLFSDAWNVFLKYPFFGGGVTYRSMDTSINVKIVYLVHNSVLQFMLWSGILGLIGLLAHLLFTAVVWFKKPNAKKSFLMSAALLIFLQSLLDITWFMPFTTFYYMLFIAAAEHDCIEKTGVGLVRGRA